MNREEAIKKVTDMYADGVSNRTVVNGIFNDFESRTCNNCMYFVKSTTPLGRCESEISLLCGELTLKNFGCNKFERKDDE